MKRSEAIFGLVRVPLDMTAVVAALALSYKLREANVDLVPGMQLLDPASTLPQFAWYLRTFVTGSAAAFVLFCASLSLYSLQTTRSAWNETGRMLVASVLWLVGIMAWYFLARRQLFYSRVLLIHSTFFIALFATFGRAAVTVLQRSLLRRGIGVHAVASVGRLTLASGAKQTLDDDIRYAYLGHVKDLAALRTLVHRREPDLILQTDPNSDSEDTLDLIEYCRSRHIGYAFLPQVLADVPHQLMVERLGLLPMIRFQPTPLDGWGRIFKRLFDVIAGTLILLVLSPLFIIISLCIVIDNGWPIFYVSKRVGEQGKRKVRVLKFRSMVKDADKRKDELRALNHRKDGPLFKVKNDPRITRVGKVLRRWSLDELPQLINVLAGSMSLVGPRPHLPEEVTLYSDYQRRVFAVKPGMTGLAQVSGRSDLSFEEEVAYDLKYVEEWTMLLDLWILWRTAMVALKKKGAD